MRGDGCSQGLLVMTDPDTPFLHVGMNAPRAEKEGGWIQRSWGVGVQNMAREYLPRSAAARATGDGFLRLQVRCLLLCSSHHTPHEDWPWHAGVLLNGVSTSCPP